MAVNPILNSGMQGIQRGLDGLERAASTIASTAAETRETSQPAEPGDRTNTEALVDLKLYKRQVQASAQVVETADAAVGFLLDKRV